MKRFLIVGMLAVSCLFAGCKTFGDETKQYSEVVTTLVSETTVRNNVILGWHLDVLKYNQLVRRQETQQDIFERTGEVVPLDKIVIFIQLENPDFDPADMSPDAEEQYIKVDIQQVIDEIDQLIKLNFELAEAMDILNESIQADKGLDPLFEDVKRILSDEELLALVTLYADKLMHRDRD